MNNSNKPGSALLGTLLSAVGTALQTDEVLRYISLSLTIIGGLLTICLNVIKWRKDAKKDGKITGEEIEDLLTKLKENIEDVKKDANDRKDK